MNKKILAAVVAASAIALSGCYHASTGGSKCDDGANYCGGGHADGSHYHKPDPRIDELYAKLRKLKQYVKDHSHASDPRIDELYARLVALEMKVDQHGHQPDPEIAKLRADLTALTEIVTTHGHSAKTKSKTIVGPPVVPAQTH